MYFHSVLLLLLSLFLIYFELSSYSVVSKKGNQTLTGYHVLIIAFIGFPIYKDQTFSCQMTPSWNHCDVVPTKIRLLPVKCYFSCIIAI